VEGSRNEHTFIYGAQVGVQALRGVGAAIRNWLIDARVISVTIVVRARVVVHTVRVGGTAVAHWGVHTLIGVGVARI